MSGRQNVFTWMVKQVLKELFRDVTKDSLCKEVYGCIAKDKSKFYSKDILRKVFTDETRTLNKMQNAYKLVIKVQLLTLHFFMRVFYLK